MINYKNKDTFLSSPDKGETIYSNHKLEFLRFFESHQRLCDEIAGLKLHTITNIQNQERIIITKNNFDFAIRKLNSFIIDYTHYISEPKKVKEIENKFNELETRFMQDELYHKYVRNSGGLTNTQQTMFNKMYLEYLIEVFEAAHLTSKYLQNSLNIASKEILKDVKFVNYDGFFNNLAAYREEVANDLSNLKFETFLDHYKKLLGYFYTYRHLIPQNEQKDIFDLLILIFQYITSDEVVKNIIRLKENSDMTNSSRQDIRNKFVIVRNAFNKVYSLCNSSLSQRNILPKTQHEVLIDTTLI